MQLSDYTPLHLTSFRPKEVSQDGIPVQQSSFPSGCEVNVKVCDILPPTSTPIVITSRVQSSDDIFKILLATDALRRLRYTTIALCIPYLPYARQDRVCFPGEAFSLEVFANLINSQNYVQVFTAHPHSPISASQIHRLYDFLPESFYPKITYGYNHPVGRVCLDHYWDVLCAPDKGALSRVQELAAYLTVIDERKYYYCYLEKQRVDNAIEIVDCRMEHPSEGYYEKRILIVDDICDGGGTFLAAAKYLQTLKPKRIGLVVTHGLFTGGVQKLLDGGIDVIYTTNSYLHPACAHEEHLITRVPL